MVAAKVKGSMPPLLWIVGPRIYNLNRVGQSDDICVRRSEKVVAESAYRID